MTLKDYDVKMGKVRERAKDPYKDHVDNFTNRKGIQL